MSIIQRGRGEHIELYDQLKKVKNVKWAVLDSGGMNIPKSDVLYLQGQGETIRIPFWCSYVETPDARLIIDTGADIADITDALTNPAAPCAVRPEDFMQTSEQTVARQLAKLDVRPEEIDFVIYSHLHFDHTGAAKLFTNAKHICQLTELRYAVKPDRFMAPGYIQSEFMPLLDKFSPIEGDAMIVPGVYCFESPGHTPGLQVIAVVPEQGQPWLLAQDGCALVENYENEWPPGEVYDPAEFVISIRRQKEIVAKLNAKHYPGHDLNLFNMMRTAPEWQYNDY